MKDIITLNQLITDINIYEEISFEYGDLKTVDQASTSTIEKILFNTSKINYICPDCKQFYPFEVSFNIYDDSDVPKKSILFYERNMNYGKEPFYLGSTEKHGLSQTIFPGAGVLPVFKGYTFPKSRFYIKYRMVCKNDPSHIHHMLVHCSLENGKMTIKKFGQLPLNTELTENILSKFDKVLRKFDIRQDFIDANSSLSRNLYPAACLYLRRIFESIVEYYEKENKIPVTKEIMEKRLPKIVNCLDPSFFSISKQLYSLLSEAIHSMNSDQIETFYESLYKAIMFQLIHEKSQLEKQKEVDEVMKSIQVAHSSKK